MRPLQSAQRIQRLEDALRGVVTLLERTNRKSGFAQPGSEEAISMCRYALHRPLFETGERVRVLVDVTQDGDDGAPQTVTGPSEGTVRGVDVREACAIYSIELDGGLTFLWNDRDEPGEVQLAKPDRSPEAAQKADKLEKDMFLISSFVLYMGTAGLNLERDDKRQGFVDATVETAWRAWKMALMARLISEAEDDEPPDDSTEEEKKRAYMVKVGGESFRCDCGCNVFHKPRPQRDPELYVCNACDTAYRGEITGPCPNPADASHDTR